MNNKDIPESWEMEFGFMWGLAPEGTLKFDKGREIKDFIRTQLQEAEKRGLDKGWLQAMEARKEVDDAEIKRQMNEAARNLPPT